MTPNPKAARAPAPEKLTGTVERVTFHSEESGFCVLRVQVRGQRDLVAVVGHLPQVVPGEWVEGRGQWVMSREHGRQFQAAELKTLPPDSIEGIEKFLGSGLIRGIGPVYAAKLVAKFGKDIFDVIEKSSAQLEQVDGIGRVRRARIKESWNETRAVRAIMAFLLSHGVSTARAFRIYKTYGDQAIPTVQQDPYCLARDIRGIGFKSADVVAEKMGIEKTSDLRARAGVEHVLAELTDEGHCACPRDLLVARSREILAIPDDIIGRAIDYGLAQGRLVAETRPEYDTPLIFLAALYHDETQLARSLRALAAGLPPCPAIDMDKAIAWVEAQVGLELAPAQREALRTAVRSKVMVITGGPGVGKTTLVNSLIRILHVKKLRVVLCAPTGRAAKRLAETTGRTAKTIHRLLEYDARSGRFRHDDQHPLAGDVFIVDETSMIDLPLAYQLVRAIPPHAALFLVGDVDQLPSVGPGMVLRDIIDSDAFPVCRLTQVFRQAAQSAIITNAHRINQGWMPEIPAAGEKSDFYFIAADDPDKAAPLIARLVKENLPAKFGFDPVTDIQVLTPMRRGTLGAHNLNAVLQAALNPDGPAIERFGCLYRAGDKVMQQSNDYDKDVFNGDIGRIRKIDPEERQLVVEFDGEDVIYDLNELDELMPSYAVTIHKSQGSEYPCVVIPVHTQHFIMLQRNLLYTAVTRGKKMVVLVGTTKALAIAVKKTEAQRRITTLRARLAGG